MKNFINFQINLCSFISMCCSTPNRNLHEPYKYDLTVLSPFIEITSNLVEFRGIHNLSRPISIIWAMSAENDLTNTKMNKSKIKIWTSVTNHDYIFKTQINKPQIILKTHISTNGNIQNGNKLSEHTCYLKLLFLFILGCHSLILMIFNWKSLNISSFFNENHWLQLIFIETHCFSLTMVQNLLKAYATAASPFIFNQGKLGSGWWLWFADAGP